MAMGQFDCWVKPHRGAVARMERQLRQMGKNNPEKGLGGVKWIWRWMQPAIRTEGGGGPDATT